MEKGVKKERRNLKSSILAWFEERDTKDGHLFLNNLFQEI